MALLHASRIRKIERLLAEDPEPLPRLARTLLAREMAAQWFRVAAAHKTRQLQHDHVTNAQPVVKRNRLRRMRWVGDVTAGAFPDAILTDFAAKQNWGTHCARPTWASVSAEARELQKFRLSLGNQSIYWHRLRRLGAIGLGYPIKDEEATCA